MSRLTLLVPLG